MYLRVVIKVLIHKTSMFKQNVLAYAIFGMHRSMWP
jgi:hypothetical protein